MGDVIRMARKRGKSWDVTKSHHRVRWEAFEEFWERTSSCDFDLQRLC